MPRDAGETVWSLPFAFETALPDRFADAAGVRYPPTFPERALREFSEPGDVVLDPFAGFGTTLAVAARLDREAVGIELEPERAAFVRERLRTGGDSDGDDADPAVEVREADLFELDPASLPAADCVVTSPPFMVEGMYRNPFENYRGRSDYASYLEDVAAAFAVVAEAVKAEGTLLVEVGNVVSDGDVTPLAWDVGEVLRDVPGLRFRGEIVLAWQPVVEGDGAGEGDSGGTGVGERDGDAIDPADLPFQVAATGREEAVGGGACGLGFDHTYCLVFEAE